MISIANDTLKNDPPCICRRQHELKFGQDKIKYLLMQICYVYVPFHFVKVSKNKQNHDKTMT